MISTMSEKERKKKLSDLFRLYMEAVGQAVNALESKQKKIAAGVLPGLEQTLSDIGGLIDQSKYAPSISYELKSKMAELQNQQQTFGEAIEGGLIKEVRTVSKWLIGLAGEIKKLLRIE